MTVTTEEAEALARQLERRLISGSISDQLEAAAVIRALAAERDLGDKQIHGLAEERERWKERAERAERDLKDQECANEMLRRFVDEQRVSRVAVEAEAEMLRDAVTAAIIAYEHDIAQGVEPSEDRRRVIAILRAALGGGKDG